MQFHNKTAYVWGLRYRWDPSLSRNPVPRFPHFMPPWSAHYHFKKHPPWYIFFLSLHFPDTSEFKFKFTAILQCARFSKCVSTEKSSVTQNSHFSTLQRRASGCFGSLLHFCTGVLVSSLVFFSLLDTLCRLANLVAKLIKASLQANSRNKRSANAFLRMIQLTL